MTTEAIIQIVESLERSRLDLCSAAKGVWESDAVLKPAPGRWSVIDCVEHVTVAETRFLGWFPDAKRLIAPRTENLREAYFFQRITDRGNLAEAPDAVKPIGRFANLLQALEAFNAVRTRTVRFTEATGLNLYQMEVEHTRFGLMTGAELMAIIAGHAQRHAAQIREIRESFDRR